MRKPRQATVSRPLRAAAAARDSGAGLATGRRGMNPTLPAPARAPDFAGMPEHEQAIVEAAKAILRARLRQAGGCMGTPKAAGDLALLHLTARERECFAVMFLDAQNGLIAFDELFEGTLTQTSVFPREVVRAALRHNAAGAIFAHNHPSGITAPSHTDEVLTAALKSALALVEVKVLDHLIVAGGQVLSFAERGLI